MTLATESAIMPMFETAEPHSGAECRAAMQQLVARGSEFLVTQPADVFHAPQGDHWSPAEHVRHLRKSTAPVARALGMPRLVLRWKFGKAKSASRSFVELQRVYNAALAAGGKAGRFTPSPEAAPADPARRRTEILDAWRGSVEDLDRSAGRWPEAALDRLVLPHPLLGNLTIREMLMFTVFHTAHHLTSITNRLERVS